MTEREQALLIANKWLEFDMNVFTQMVPGDPDCDACVLARQFIRLHELLLSEGAPDVTDKEILDLTNDLARKFYAMHGCERGPEFRFDRATHPQEALMWKLAVEAMETLHGTDPNDAASNLEDA